MLTAILAEVHWMTGALLAALSVGGLLIGFLLLYVRFARIEGLLSRLQEIQSLTDEIRELRRTMSGITLKQLEVLMDSVREHSRSMDATLDGVYRGILQLNEHFGMRRGQAVKDLVERKFFGQGYDSVVILSDLSGDLEEPLELQVEAVRGGLSYKGTVVIQNDSVVSAQLKPSYGVFP
ncbi:MAG: hypothetical protein JXQ29_08065 [Planctomycetes bacterium]|nr:hypothetical protein [Planctomycetota bacterium]